MTRIVAVLSLAAVLAAAFAPVAYTYQSLA